MNSSHKKYCEEFQTGKVLGRPLKSPHWPQSRCILYCFHFYAKSRALSSVFAISNWAFTFTIQASFSKSRCLLRWICHTKRIIKNFHLERILVGFSNPPTGHEGEEFRVVSVLRLVPCFVVHLCCVERSIYLNDTCLILCEWMLCPLSSPQKKNYKEFPTGKALGGPLKSPHGPRGRQIL